MLILILKIITMKKGTFVSVWDDGVEISTPATLDKKTGEIISEPINVNGLDLDILQKEYFLDEDENEHEVCPECHSYILKIVMVDGIEHTLNEVQICSDPDCSNY